MMTKPLMSEAEHARVAAAVRKAEEETSGEIICVLARSSDSYFANAGLSAALATALAGLIVAIIAFGFDRNASVLMFAIAEVAAFATILALLWFVPSVRIAFVPKRVRYRRAHENALRQFLARNVHRTAARTGILIFVSVAERYAEIVADAGIDAKVEQTAWNDMVARLIEDVRHRHYAAGFEAAAHRAGELLSVHFPKGSGDVNELADHVVEL